MKDVEEAYIRLTLDHTEGNRRRAAGILGISLHTLYNKLRLYRGKRQEPQQVTVAPRQGSGCLSKPRV